MLLNCDVEKTLESPLDSKEIQPIYPKGDRSWMFSGRSDVEAETPILWPPDMKSWLIWKDWCWERLEVGEKGKTEMVGLHHQLMDMILGKLWEFVMNREAWWAAVHGITKSQTPLGNWTELNVALYVNSCALFMLVSKSFLFMLDLFHENLYSAFDLPFKYLRTVICQLLFFTAFFTST